jgi:hypothetical protein
MPTLEETPKKKNSKWKVLLTLFIFIILLGVFFKFFMQVRHIQSGYIGIKSSAGSLINNSADYDIQTVKGYVVYIPMYTELVILPTTIQNAAYDSLRINTKDGVEFIVKPRVSYQLDETKSDLFFKNCHKQLDDIKKSYLKEIVANAYSSIASIYNSDSLVANKQNFEVEVNQNLNIKMSEIGLILRNTNSNLEIPQKIKDIIELRSIALQHAILAEDKKKQIEAEAEIQIIKANTIRKEDSLKNTSLTDYAIQKMFIEKWDGKLPVYGETPKIYKNITE